MKKNPESCERKPTHSLYRKNYSMTEFLIPNHRVQKEVAQPFLSDESKELSTQNSRPVKISFRNKGEIYGKVKELG